jgi:hypothetical protein
MIYIGIDVGMSGGIGAINDKNEIIELIPMPLSGKEIDPREISKILALLCSQGDAHVFIEHAQAMPKNGAVGMFRYGMGFGYLIGICASAAYPMTLVKPRLWQKTMHVGADASADPKDRTFQVVYRLFPKANLKPTPRCKKDSDGMADALLIAAYGRIALVGTRGANCA